LAGRVGPGLPAAERPSAAVTVYSAARREIWQVGDVGFWYAGLADGVGQPRKLVDQVATAMRVAVIAAEMAAGPFDLDLDLDTADAEADPGRVAARALISRQGALRNTTGVYGYAGIDGRPVPESLVLVHPVPAGVGELVLASDGYPVLGGTLAECEAALAGLLARDPWCVAELAGTKGLVSGQVSFDDRAYLRVRL
jgi:hypothetical protein